jgi:hypothetical protein
LPILELPKAKGNGQKDPDAGSAAMIDRRYAPRQKTYKAARIASAETAR